MVDTFLYEWLVKVRKGWQCAKALDIWQLFLVTGGLSIQIKSFKFFVLDCLRSLIAVVLLQVNNWAAFFAFVFFFFDKIWTCIPRYLVNLMKNSPSYHLLHMLGHCKTQCNSYVADIFVEQLKCMADNSLCVAKVAFLFFLVLTTPVCHQPLLSQWNLVMKRKVVMNTWEGNAWSATYMICR